MNNSTPYTLPQYPRKETDIYTQNENKIPVMIGNQVIMYVPKGSTVYAGGGGNIKEAYRND